MRRKKVSHVCPWGNIPASEMVTVTVSLPKCVLETLNLVVRFTKTTVERELQEAVCAHVRRQAAVIIQIVDEVFAIREAEALKRQRGARS